MFKQLLACSLSMALGVSITAAKEPTAKVAQSSKRDLTSESFPKLHSLIRPHETEWRHLKVEWITDVTAARRKAASEDKPTPRHKWVTARRWAITPASSRSCRAWRGGAATDWGGSGRRR